MARTWTEKYNEQSATLADNVALLRERLAAHKEAQADCPGAFGFVADISEANSRILEIIAFLTPAIEKGN